MERSIQNTLILILTLASGIGLTRLSHLSSENRSMQERLSILEKSAPREAARQNPIIPGADNRLQRLEKRISEQTLLSEAARKKLEQEEGSPGTTSDLSSLRDKLSQEEKVIEGLQTQRQSTRAQASALRAQSHADQARQALAQKASSDEVSAEIIQEQQSLDSLNQRLSSARKAYESNEFDLQAAQGFLDLQSQVSAQSNQIQALKDRRASDNAQRTYEKSLSLSQNQQSIDELDATDQALSDQLSREREVLRNLQNDVNAGAQSQNTRQILIKSAELDYQFQKNSLTELQARLEEEQARLHRQESRQY